MKFKFIKIIINIAEISKNTIFEVSFLSIKAQDKFSNHYVSLSTSPGNKNEKSIFDSY